MHALSSAAELMGQINSDGIANGTVTRQALKRAIERLNGIHVRFEPTNASTKDILCNILGFSAFVGSALVIGAWIAKRAPHPVVIAAGFIMGAALGLMITRYKISIHRKDGPGDLFHVEIEKV